MLVDYLCLSSFIGFGFGFPLLFSAAEMRLLSALLSFCTQRFLQQAQWIDAFENVAEALKRLLAAVRMVIPDVPEAPKASGVPHSSGTQMLLKDNTLYEGEYRSGNRSGYGKYIYPDGIVYEGQWKDGKCHGQGKRIYKDGSQWVGKFRKGKKWDGLRLVVQPRCIPICRPPMYHGYIGGYIVPGWQRYVDKISLTYGESFIIIVMMYQRPQGRGTG